MNLERPSGKSDDEIYHIAEELSADPFALRRSVREALNRHPNSGIPLIETLTNPLNNGVFMDPEELYLIPPYVKEDFFATENSISELIETLKIKGDSVIDKISTIGNADVKPSSSGDYYHMFLISQSPWGEIKFTFHDTPKEKDEKLVIQTFERTLDIKGNVKNINTYNAELFLRQGNCTIREYSEEEDSNVRPTNNFVRLSPGDFKISGESERIIDKTLSIMDFYIGDTTE